MSKVEIIAAGFCAVALLLVGLLPEWTSAAAVACAFLYLGVCTVTKSKSPASTDLEAQVKDLKNKVEAIMITKSFGR